ncbi:MAG: hypothetical protein HQL87_14875 [Magnetococcales bacterium]|nr:hypothetical protein [Magnetococcales bacterium]
MEPLSRPWFAEPANIYTVPNLDTGSFAPGALAQFRRDVGALAKEMWYGAYLPQELAQSSGIHLHDAPLNAAIDLAVGEIDKQGRLSDTAPCLVEQDVWSGACLTNGLHRMRPIQIAQYVQVEDHFYPLLPYLNDIFALEFGWCTAFYWRRLKTHAGMDIAAGKHFTVALAHMRRNSEAANAIFHQLLMGSVSVLELAFFYKILMQN